MKKKDDTKTRKFTAADKVAALKAVIADMKMDTARKEHALPIKVAAGIDAALGKEERYICQALEVAFAPMPWYWGKKRRADELSQRVVEFIEALPTLAQALQDEIMRCIATEDADESSH